MPNISSSGKARPQSITTMSSPYSNRVMFRPISPTPPSGRTRSTPGATLTPAPRPITGTTPRGFVAPSRPELRGGCLGRRERGRRRFDLDVDGSGVDRDADRVFLDLDRHGVGQRVV